MLYTKKGDNGTTKLFDCPQGMRLSKSSFVFEVLGTIDELNSSIGYAKALSTKYKLSVFMKNKKVSYEEILDIFQQNLFYIQAELGGSPMHASKEQIFFLEEVIYEVETLLPPLKSFIIPGGGEAGAYLDIARTIARRAERQTIILRDKQERKINDTSIQFQSPFERPVCACSFCKLSRRLHREKTPI